MATWQHLRSSTANKRPTTSLADGRIAINTNTASPGLFFKDSAGTGIVKVGPVHVGTTAPNSVPASGGSTGNYTGEQWLDTSVSPAQMKVWNGSTWVGIVADELPVSKLQDGAPRQLIQTDAAGTGVEWTSDVDVPGTLDVTSTATFDSIAQHPLGSAGAPTITFTGDTNTGIYSPGADQVAVATSGAGRVFVDASGKVGLGGTPNYNLDVYTGSANFQGSNQGIYWDSATNKCAILGDTGALKFSTGTSSVTERLRITSAGLVGVGTSSPSEALTVAGNIRVNNSNPTLGLYGANGTSPQVIFGNSAGTAHYSIYETTDPSTGTRGSLNIYDVVAAASRVTVDTSGRVGIGTASPSALLHVSDASAKIRIGVDASSQYLDIYRDNATGNTIYNAAQAAAFRGHVWQLGGAEAARIDSSGRLLVGTSTAQGTSILQAVGNSSASTDPGDIRIIRGLNVSSIGPNTGAELGIIRFGALENSVCAQISAVCDANWSANDTPGRLVFSTTADGASSPTERMRITSSGYTRAVANGTGPLNYGHEFSDNASNNITLSVYNSSGSFAQDGGGMLFINCGTSASSTYTFLGVYSGNGADREFRFRGDGNAYADGSWTGGGADYAEYFEWSDSNPDAEDRRGISVVLDGDKIREAQAGEDPIGVISGNPSVVGDAAWNKWNGKYLRDEFGTYIQESYEVTDDDGNTVTQQRRKLNPAYDPDVEYVSREQRPEWDCVGLMGKLRIRKGQVTGPRWIKMRDISDSVEEWLVR